MNLDTWNKETSIEMKDIHHFMIWASQNLVYLVPYILFDKHPLLQKFLGSVICCSVVLVH